MRRNFIFAAGLVLVFICAQTVRAEMFSFSKSMSGTIADVRPDAISLTPANPNQATGTAPVDLQINDSTKLKNMQAVTDLKKGDDIQVRYKEQDGKKVAVQVEKNASGDTAATDAAAVDAAAVTSNPADRGDGIAEERNQINQGTNQAAANKQDTMTQSDDTSSFEPIPNQGQQMPSQDGQTTISTTTTTTRSDVSVPDPAMENSGQAYPTEGQVQSSDPSVAEGTPAMQR
jgi:hypothetical protein